MNYIDNLYLNNRMIFENPPVLLALIDQFNLNI